MSYALNIADLNNARQIARTIQSDAQLVGFTIEPETRENKQATQRIEDAAVRIE